MIKKFKLKVPGTSANIGVGYDCLGVALDFEMELEISRSTNIEFKENNVDFNVPLEENYIYMAINYVQKYLGKNIPNYRVNILKNNIPMARGLGSSSSAIVAGIFIVNTFLENLLSIEEIIKIAVEIEGHPDNVVPAILGGMVITSWDNEKILYRKINTHNDLYYYVMIPNFKLSTAKAREVLPNNYSIGDIINNMSKLSILLKDLQDKKYENLRYLLGDKIHQPYRMRLINNSNKIFDMCEKLGAKGEYISGAGPTLIALNYDDNSFFNGMKEFLKTLSDQWTVEKKGINYIGTSIYDVEYY